MEFRREGDRCRVDLVLEGLQASSRFWQDDAYALGTGPYNEGPGISGFLADLAENWRGWTGSKSWGDLEGLIRIEATHDGRGHVSLDFDLRSSLYDGWRVEATVPVEAGQLDALVRAARAFDAEPSA